MFASWEFHHKWLECVRHDVHCISISPWIKLAGQTLCWSTRAVVPPVCKGVKSISSRCWSGTLNKSCESREEAHC